MPRFVSSKLLFVLFFAAVVGLTYFAQDRTHLYAVVAIALFAGAILFGLWKRNDVSMGQVLFGAVVFRLMLVWLPPSLSDDAYRYVWDGLVQRQGVNPYHYTPDDSALVALQQEPIFERLNSRSYFSVYPPVSQGIFLFGTLFYGRGWIACYYAIKAVLVLLEMAAVLLLSRMVAPRFLLLYAWNPLVLLETAGQAHTESILIVLLVLTVLLARRGRGGWASITLVMAGWVKLYPFFLFPFLWRRFRWKAFWPATVVGILLAAPYTASYVWPNVKTSLDLYARLFEFNAGFYYAVKQIFYVITGEDWSKQIGPAFRMFFFMALPVVYVLDKRYAWSLTRVFLITLGTFVFFATTVHPWYLLSILLLCVLLQRLSWHWYWLGLFSIGTYLLYVDGPYWLFVWLGWGGWFVIAGIKYGPSALQWIQQQRARQKYQFIRLFLPRLKSPLDVLDLGAGEGYVGQAIHEAMRARVTLVDVVPMNRTSLTHVVYDGKQLPFLEDEFDVTVLYFVLHHADDQRQVLREAMRVTSGRVLVVESVYEGKWDYKLLVFLDKLVNRIRSGGRMKMQEAFLHFRRVSSWRAFFEAEGLTVLAERRRGRWIHKQALFVLQKKR